jgi:hypothetical protein
MRLGKQAENSAYNIQREYAPKSTVYLNYLEISKSTNLPRVRFSSLQQRLV